jgi:chain length determinant protein EpsF
MANAFAKSYIATNLEMRISPAQLTAEWFGGQLKTLRENLEQARNKLTTYQRAKGIVSADERLDVENARLNELSSQSLVMQAQAIDSEKRERQAAAFLASGSLDTLPEVLSNPFIQNLKSDILKSEANLKQLSSQVGVNHPLYRRAQEELESLKAKLTDEVRKIAVGLANSHQVNQQREARLRADLATQKARVLSLKQVRDELDVLTRDVDSAQRAYDTAAQRLTQSSLESQANQTNITILSPAVPPLRPSFPNMGLNVALAVVIGSMLGVGFALLRELLDQRVRRTEDLADVCGVSVLAIVETAKPVSRWFERLRSSALRGRPQAAAR